MMTTIAISRLHFPITTLGPGKRIGIWVQGCSIRCSGCISADTWATGTGETTVEAVVDAIRPWLAHAQGVTISGGEPFDQPVALEALVRAIRAEMNGDILIFTGYSFSAVQRHIHRLSGLIDGLITDPYDRNAPQTLALRGSDNQELHCLTPVGEARFSGYNRLATPDDRRLEVMFDDEHGSVWMVGIPAHDHFPRLRNMLEASGHRVQLSDESFRETPQ